MFHVYKLSQLPVSWTSITIITQAPSHVHSTSAASVASAGFESASAGSTAGTFEASWGVRTERSYVGSQDKVGDHKHLIKKWWICTIRQLMEFI